MIFEYNGDYPEIHHSAYVASTAIVSGKAVLKENASLFFGVSARGDVNSISVGKNSNIQDNATLHVALEHPCIIGDNCVIGHNAVVHGAVLNDYVLVGIGAIVLNGVQVGKYSIIAAGAVVPEGSIIPDYSMVMGIPAKVIRSTTENERKMIEIISERYIQVMNQYKQQDK